MTNRYPMITAVALAALLPLAAGAADKPPAAAASKAAEASETASPAAPASKGKKVEIRCESTASRIVRNKVEDCARSAQPTTNYYPHDLERGGETDMGKTLRNLDPRFQ
jgi:hypothetical protein